MEKKERLSCNLTGLFKDPGRTSERDTLQNITLKFLNFNDKKKTLQITRKNNYLKLKKNEITWDFVTVQMRRTVKLRALREKAEPPKHPTHTVNVKEVFAKI